LNAINALSNCFSSNWFSPLKREPFAGCAIDTEVVFFIESQKSEKGRGFPIANFDPVRMNP